MKLKKIASIILKKFKLPKTTALDRHYILRKELGGHFSYHYFSEELRSHFVFGKFSPNFTLFLYSKAKELQRFFLFPNKLASTNIKLIWFLIFSSEILIEKELLVALGKFFDFETKSFKLSLQLADEESIKIFSLYYLNFYYLVFYLLILAIFRQYEA